ncbi:MAG TPA: 3-deoxy-manno-octulosonate cytidylyltransferase [Thermoanaerobaculia bacterium]|nr:3-deoxy-manno-octulosonate cytidylyltransferase [Thermoanaerobaculia bacterium]
MEAVIVIPSRWGSTRFPGKPLAQIAGKTLIAHVIARAKKARRAAAVWVATDDPRIADEAVANGARAVMPAGDHQSGTDRIAAAIAQIEESEGKSFSQVINVQGDEPLLDADLVDRMIAVLQSETIDIATLSCPLLSEAEHRDPNVVKVVVDQRGNALYFSRAPIPAGEWSAGRRHIGVYGFQTTSLRRFASLPPSSLEVNECLEQLRALENGFTIRVLETDAPHPGVDRPEDVQKIERELAGHD